MKFKDKSELGEHYVNITNNDLLSTIRDIEDTIGLSQNSVVRLVKKVIDNYKE